MTFGTPEGGRFQHVAGLDQAGADAIVRRAVDAGINFIDTANVYSEGASEEITGRAIRNLGLARSDVVLATKVMGGMGPGVNDKGASRGHIMDQVKASLRRLDTDYITAEYPEWMFAVQGAYRVLDEASRSRWED